MEAEKEAKWGSPLCVRRTLRAGTHVPCVGFLAEFSLQTKVKREVSGVRGGYPQIISGFSHQE